MKRIIYYILSSCLLLTTGCSNWLDVKPSNRVEQEEMFSTEDGFKNSLTGVYINLKSGSLYGQTLTMELNEYLAQHWKTNASETPGYISAYDYENSSVQSMIDQVYTDFYNTIVNINNLLDFVDNGVLSEDMYNLIKGEALGLRAFCHLDLLRLYGPIPGKQTDKKILSYAGEVSRQNMPVNTWAEYVAFLEQDLNEAEALLEKVEKKGIENDYFTYRQNRMNYWAVMAVKARFYLWIQNKEKAAEYAAKVIAGAGVQFKLSQPENFTNKDYIASSEHLFSIHVYNLEDITEAFFYRAGGVEQTKSLIAKLFEGDVTDIRGDEKLWKQLKGLNSGDRYVLMKYKQSEALVTTREQIPLVRLYEMYLIAIECSDEASVYQPLIKQLLTARNMSLDMDNAGVDQKNQFVAMEYHKEFYGEGQAFYQSKRRNDETIMWSNTPGSASVYVLPIPKGEIKYEE